MTDNQPQSCPGYLRFRNRAPAAPWQSIVSPVLSTSLYFVVFGAAEVHGSPKSREYPMVMRARVDHAHTPTQSTMNASFGIYFPRFDRAISRNPLSAGIALSNGSRLRSGRRNQIDHPWPDHPGNLAASSTPAHCAPVLDGHVPRSDGSDLQPPWLHYRDLGGGCGKLQIVPLLIITPLTFLGCGTFYRPASCRRPGKPSRCSTRWSIDQRIPLELLRNCRCQPCRQRRHDLCFSLSSA